MKNIILDTNFLMIPFNLKVDIFSEIERICYFNYRIEILDKTVDELNNIISEQRGKYKEAAAFGLMLIKKKGVGVIKTKQGKVDDLIVEMSDKEKYVVATQDKELKKRLKENGVKIIVLRQKRYLDFW